MDGVIHVALSNLALTFLVLGLLAPGIALEKQRLRRCATDP